MPQYSPRTWGWTVVVVQGGPKFGVFPTHVGMDRMTASPATYTLRIPHARGDGPRECILNPRPSGYSPRTWGWTEALRARLKHFDVFPTHVGMDRLRRIAHSAPEGIPHARGDGPISDGIGVGDWKYSPRTWGWTERLKDSILAKFVFPTHVGMDRAAVRS